MRNSEVGDLIAVAHALVDLTQSCQDDLAATSLAALVTIRRDEPMSIGEIAEIVGLSHSATVRLVDRLEKNWLVRRGERNGREVLVETTARGKRRVTALTKSIEGSVLGVLENLSERDRKTLQAGISAVVGALIESGHDQKRLFRYGGSGAEH